MKRAVITGPTGSIGLALINELASNGVEVVAVVRPVQDVQTGLRQVIW